MSKVLHTFFIFLISLASFTALAGLGRQRGYEDEPPGNTECPEGSIKDRVKQNLGGQACYVMCVKNGGGIACNSLNKRITNRISPIKPLESYSGGDQI